VQGLPAKNQDKIQKPVRGLSALSEYKIIQKRKDFTVVEISPLTGRTNQIRIHFKSIGHPLVGEAKFAFRKDYKLKAKRICLHAKSLEFIHPITRQVIKIDSPLPEDLEDFLNTH
jgi:23S rRNA-/tRNA-specific pseudouridylate synthase